MLRGEITPGKLGFLSAGCLIGGGAVITNWTHVLYFSPDMFFLGIALVLINWRVR